MLDEKDWTILEQVQQNARIPFAELGRRAGLSAPAAAERLRRLEDAGVITSYRAGVAPDKLGLSLSAFIEVQVKRADYGKFQAAVADLPWVLECHHVSGRANDEITVRDIATLKKSVTYDVLTNWRLRLRRKSVNGHHKPVQELSSAVK